MRFRNGVIQTLTVFSSLGTLLCCALPALLVSLGAGAALASVVSIVPQLVWLSEHKVPLFIFAGVMLVLSSISTYRNYHAPCPTDPIERKACLRVRRLSQAVLCSSLALYAIGFFFAFVASRIGG